MNKISLEWRLSKTDGIPDQCWLEYVIDGVSLAEVLTTPVQNNYDEVYGNLKPKESEKALTSGALERLSITEPLGKISVLRMVWDYDLRAFFSDLTHQYVVEHLEMLLTLRLADVLGSGRVPLYTCSVCGDYDCGTICVHILRNGDCIEWREFRQEVNYGWEEDGNWVPGLSDCAQEWADIGPFTFNYAEYEQCLRCPPPIPIEILRQLRA